MRGGYEVALANLRRHGIRLYGTFIFGYDGDTAESFARATEFAKAHRFYIAAFNHLTPFPGHAAVPTARSARAGCSTTRWWLDERYRYNMVPFQAGGHGRRKNSGAVPRARGGTFTPGRASSAAGSIGEPRGRVHVPELLPDQRMLRVDTNRRDGYPLGDESWHGPLLRAH